MNTIHRFFDHFPNKILWVFDYPNARSSVAVKMDYQVQDRDYCHQHQSMIGKKKQRFCLISNPVDR